MFPDYLSLFYGYDVSNVILFVKQNILILYCLKLTPCVTKKVICEKIVRSFSFVSLKYIFFFSFGVALRKEVLYERSRTGANNRPSVLTTINKNCYTFTYLHLRIFIFILRVHIYEAVVIIYY